MFFRKARKAAAALHSLMSQTRDTMVCFDFRVPIDPQEPQHVIDAKLRDCVVVDASRSFALYFGFSKREDVIGRPLIDLFDNGQIPEWFINYGQEVENRNFANLERVVAIPVSGELREMRIHMQNIFDGELLVRQWITIRDVSREEQNRRAVEENERLRVLALEAVGLRTFSLEFDPHNTEQRHGAITVSGGIHPDWWENIHEDDRPAMEQAFTRFYKGETDQLHTLFRTATEKDSEVWMESWAVASHRDEQGQPVGISGVIMDRTQSKALEAKLIASQRLESLGVLAGGIAHDFNNLLMSVTGSVDIATQRHPELGEELRLIDDAARQATLLCDQLLTYAGRGSAELAPLDLSEAIEGFKELLTLSVDKNARVILQIEENCWVRGDSSQLGQVLMNLVKNASDALVGAPGEIVVRLHEADFQEQWRVDFHQGARLRPGKYITLEVQDTGKGMSPAELEHLFDPFYTTKFTGRGLGMAVVMGVVRGHAGAVQVTSKPQQGTVVQVVLPASAPPQQHPPPLEDPSARALRGCVMVVDDEAAVREVASNLISSMGAEVELAASGEQALALFLDNPARYQAILMDVTMPGLDGVETASRILARYPDTNIVMCSGYSNITMPSKLTDAVHFLQKPYRLSQLHDKLKPLLSNT